MIDPKKVVEEAYDEIADRFGEWRAAIKGSPDDEWLDVLLTKLHKQADVLELGSGQGSVARRIIAAGHRYVGVDISAEQVRRARELVPQAEFRHGDSIELERVEVVSIAEPEGPASFLWVLAAQTRFGTGPAGNTSATQPEGETVDRDRIEGELKEQEGKLTGDEVREKQGQTQEKWGEAKDKTDDVKDEIDDRL